MLRLPVGEQGLLLPRHLRLPQRPEPRQLLMLQLQQLACPRPRQRWHLVLDLARLPLLCVSAQPALAVAAAQEALKEREMRDEMEQRQQLPASVLSVHTLASLTMTLRPQRQKPQAALLLRKCCASDAIGSAPWPLRLRASTLTRSTGCRRHRDWASFLTPHPHEMWLLSSADAPACPGKRLVSTLASQTMRSMPFKRQCAPHSWTPLISLA